MNFKKYLKILGLSVGTILPIASSISCGEYKEVTGRGSSSVFPIIQQLIDGGTDIAYTVSGSGDGFHSQNKKVPQTDFGMMSSQKIPKTSGKEEWVNPNIRTVTFAVDAIAIAVNLPTGFKIQNNEDPLLIGTEIAKLFDMDTTNDPDWGTLIANEVANTSGSKSKVNVFGRDGGKEKSGTADGFFHTLGHEFGKGLKLDKGHEKLSPAQKTKEPNSAAAQALKTKPGSLTYLSLGYAKNNKSAKLKVAKIKTASGIWDYNNIQAYGWKRPFNIAYSVKNQDALKFVEKLLSKKVQDNIIGKQYVKLTQAQLDQQTKMYKSLPISLTTTDKEINQRGANTKGDLYFGMVL